jgi:predicted ribosomally synthesized six-cysteine peptide SCIFF
MVQYLKLSLSGIKVLKSKEAIYMKHIKTLTTRDYKESMKKGGCGECQTSCQSACKTSCTVGNQSCENANK